MIQNTINLILALIKWPLAILMVALFFPSILALLFMLDSAAYGEAFMAFGISMLAVVALWVVFFRKSDGSAFAVFEHELTHMIFALLTFHRPESISVSRRRGGMFTYHGHGNWLIALAPYFFPTLPFLVMAGSVMYQITGEYIPLFIFVILGVLTGYHLCTTFMEVHAKQSDFKQAGRVFSFLFLPTANVFAYGCVLAYVLFGWGGAWTFLRTVGICAISIFA